MSVTARSIGTTGRQPSVPRRDIAAVVGPGHSELARTGHQRLAGFDVVRSVALIGVVLMNYHAYLNDPPDVPSFAERVFDPQRGVFATRFAATFVMVAGVGVVLFTNRSRLSGDPSAVAEDRWRLIRRGMVLLSFGYVLDWIWAGTILFFYGAFFIVAAGLFTVRTAWLAVVGVGSTFGAWGVQVWARQRRLDGFDTTWLLGSGRASALASSMRSPRDAALDVVIHGTHPLMPWLAFFCGGTIIGRLVPVLDRWRRRIVLAGMAMVVVGYGAATMLRIRSAEMSGDVGEHLRALARTDPWGRQPLFVVTTLGSSLVAVVGIAWLADRFASHTVVDVLRRAGQMTLSLYVLHVLVFRAVVDVAGWVRPTGLDTAVVFTAGVWVVLIVAGAGWHRRRGSGPLEVLYRRFGG